MRILVIGAGATGGYFGGRLLEAGRDVHFLVREKRAALLAKTGLVIKSPTGDVHIAAPPTVQAGKLGGFYDLILLSCKAYDLESAIHSFAPAVGPGTAILPLLNGMAHLDILERRFGAEAVLGGVCMIAATLDGEGRIIHFNDVHGIILGERSGAASPRTAAIAAAMRGAKFDSRVSEAILLEMWEKWVFIASLAGITCLNRAAIGDIVAAGGAETALALLEECRSIAAAAGYPPRQAFLERMTPNFTQAGSPLTASMLRDVERGGAVEADHVIGDLLSRGGKTLADRSLLALVYLHLKAYEARRARTAPR